jgi:leader peptidase (prepilin peptidase)/N-methyltransferase
MALPPEPWVSILATVVGLVVGSFLNVCVHRMPRGESIVRPRSRCPNCGTPIASWRNVPLVSWLALRGRCAACRAPISWRYPAIELLTGLLTLGLWRLLGPSYAFAIAAVFAWMLVVLFFTDWDHQLLPDAVTLTGLGLGLAAAWFNPALGEAGTGRVWSALSGAALGSGMLWAVGAVWKRFRGVEAMGLGDVKMMAMVGAFAGPTGVLFTLFAASFAGAVVGLALIPLRGGTMRDALPFGCFLAPAALAALLWAQRALAAYLGLLGL